MKQLIFLLLAIFMLSSCADNKKSTNAELANTTDEDTSSESKTPDEKFQEIIAELNNANKKEKKNTSKTNTFWLDNTPCNIPFEAKSKPKAFEVKSITAIGKKNGGYALTIVCKGLKSVASGDPSGFKSLTLKQKDKDNPNAHTPAAYHAPAFEEGEEFSFEIVNLFDGYFNPNKFESFVVEY